MNTRDTIPDIDRQGLRNFGLTTGTIVAALFGLFFPWMLESAFPVWPWAILAVLGAWALIAPDSLNPVYRAWMRLGLLLSKITTPLIMGIVFFFVIMPFGIVLRFLGKDPMRKGFDKTTTSYRIKSMKATKENLENPF